MKEINIPFTIPPEVNLLIEKYFPVESPGYRYYFTHVVNVTGLAVKLAEKHPGMNLDMDFIVRGAMLHDIGIVMTDAPGIGCFGSYPYIAHTYLGREILEREGFERIAPVCERHIGVGLTLDDIRNQKLPLPLREMVPVTPEEKLICYADKFFSKSIRHLEAPRTVQEVIRKIRQYGDDKVGIFKGFMELFGTDF